jgi:hypothetical protein
LENPDLLANLDRAEVSPEFIGIPPLPAELMQQGHHRVTGARREESGHGAEIGETGVAEATVQLGLPRR